MFFPPASSESEPGDWPCGIRLLIATSLLDRYRTPLIHVIRLLEEHALSDFNTVPEWWQILPVAPQ
ncbi:hypothetical protein [Planctomicrobium sp. SH527]|uniref:hypothetical protein n=1 Tax=Planctomicrobium sp. SH527 TaxID=3448123 RepID=UPI003F5C4571